MKGRSTLVLLISIVVLGAFIWLQETWRARNFDKVAQQVRLFNLDAEDLQWIEFKLTNTVVRFSKENGVWMAGTADEGTGRADVALIQRMLSGLNSIGKGTTITSKHLEIRGLDSSEYGFDQPTVEITAVDNEGEHRWLVGRHTPLDDMVYVKQGGGDDIFTVPDKLFIIVPTSPDALRDRVLFPGEAAGVRRVEIRGSEGFVQLVKDPSAGWRIQQPVSAPADEAEIQNFVENLYLLRVEDFVADNVSDFSIYGLQDELQQISLGGSDGASRMLVVGDDVPDRPGFVYVRRADDTSVFTLSADVLQFLNVKAERFRDARVVDIAPGDITSISISRGAERLGLELDPATGWQMVSPAWKADPMAVTELAKLWMMAVITDYNVSTNDVPAEWVLEFGSSLASRTNRVEVLPAGDRKDGLLIRRDGSPSVYQINLPAMPDSIIDPLSFKDPMVWEIKPAGVDKVSVLRAGQPGQVVERREDRSFAAAGTNASVRVDSAAFGKLLGQLSRVEASGYIAYNPSDLGIYGLDNPALELHVALSATNELGRVLMVGRETADGFYSMVKGRDVVFFLDKNVVDTLSANLLEEPTVAAPVSE